MIFAIFPIVKYSLNRKLNLKNAQFSIQQNAHEMRFSSKMIQQ